MYQIFSDLKIPWYSLACCMLYPAEISIEQSLYIICPNDGTDNGNPSQSKWEMEHIKRQEDIEICRLHESGITWADVGKRFNLNQNTVFKRAQRYKNRINKTIRPSDVHCYRCESCGKLVYRDCREKHLSSGHIYGVRKTQ